MTIDTAPQLNPEASLTIDESELALCRQIGTGSADIFFPERGETNREAKKVCAACPIRLRCLEVAITNGEHYGIFGGLSPTERRMFAKGEPIPEPVVKLAPAPEHGTVAGWRRHGKDVEEPCQECTDAYDVWIAKVRAAAVEGGKGSYSKSPIDHGTEAGYHKHRRRGIPACAECLAAHSMHGRVAVSA